MKSKLIYDNDINTEFYQNVCDIKERKMGKVFFKEWLKRGAILVKNSSNKV